MPGLVVILGILAFCNASPMMNPGGRIVGGTVADIKDFPYQVSLQFVGKVNDGGGSIISQDWVLTCAHCVQGQTPESMQVRVGSAHKDSGGSIHNITKIISHENYSDHNYDIALMKVSPPFTFSDNVKMIPLQEEEVAVGTMAVTSGWGVTDENYVDFSQVLYQVEVPVFDHDKCDKDYRIYLKITEVMLCAGYDEGGKDACGGDSGGPLAANGKLIGVVSFGKGCAEPNYPGVYADVAALRSWIVEKSGI